MASGPITSWQIEREKVGFPGGTSGKESTCQWRKLKRCWLNPLGLERSPGEGNGNPLKYSHLGNPMDRGTLQATVHGVSRVGHDWVTFTSLGKIPWRRAWQPTPVLLPGESHEQRSLEGYSPWSRKDLKNSWSYLVFLKCLISFYFLVSSKQFLKKRSCIFPKQSCEFLSIICTFRN